MKPKLSIIVVTYNLPTQLKGPTFLDILPTLPEWVELIVWDNCSRADLREALQQQLTGRTNVRLVCHTENNGFGAACNSAVKLSTSNVLFFLNPDCTFGPSMWPVLEDMVTEISCRTFRVIQPIVLRGDGLTIDTCGEKLFLGGGVVKMGDGVRLTDLPRSIAEFSKLFENHKAGPSGAAFLIDRGLFEEMKGFDPTFFLLKEDTDLAIRLSQKRITTHLEPRLILQHQVSLVVNTLGSQKIFLAVRNYFFVLFKNSSLIEFLINAPVVLLQTALLLAYHWRVSHQLPAALKGVVHGIVEGAQRLNQTGRFLTFHYARLNNPIGPWKEKLQSRRAP